MKPSTMKYMFYGIILFIFIGFIYTSIVGKKQDEANISNFEQYQQAVQLAETNKFDQAIKILENLALKYPDEYLLNYNIGQIYSAKGDFEQAALNYQKAIDTRPALLQDQTFVYKMGESLFKIKEYEMSKAYLLNPVPEKLQKQKDEMLQLIEKENQS